MDEAEAGQVSELIEVTTEEPEASEPEEAAIPDPPETVVGVVHELGSIAALVNQLSDRADALENQIAAVRSEIAGVARVEAEALLDEIIQEGQSGEAQAEAEAAPAARPSLWERILGGG